MALQRSVSDASVFIAAATSSGISGSAQMPHPICALKDAASVSFGDTARMGLPAARIPYILLGTTTPSRPRFIVITCASAAAKTDGILLAGKNGRNRTFLRLL